MPKKAISSSNQSCNIPSYPQSLPPVRPQPQDPVPPVKQLPTAPASTLNDLQTQLQDTQTSLASHIWALEGVFAEHKAIKRKVGMLRQLMESKTASKRQHEEEEFGSGDDDDTRSIGTVVPHELEPVVEENEDQLARQEEEDEEDRRRRRQLTALYSSLHWNFSALELSSSLLAQHAIAQSTISALELKVSELETLVKTTQLQPQPAPVVEVTPYPSETLTQMLTDWKKSVEGQWSSVRAEWAAEPPSPPRLHMNTVTTLLNQLKINESTSFSRHPINIVFTVLEETLDECA
ncbi:hypothetical protein PILCRDRAFT_1887 [Piloderma croceum F 1598]|uniref:Uncharacterized protein n=1 Tax=Piloderma croceum (strain F 1598) TaxID=765440 RepID=A0A0C3GJ02_PILCF|nr:hypothetical protein PILCRDRAFT_1887 [Piloderma croceum F 1598]